jgi:hypothetical protein
MTDLDPRRIEAAMTTSRYAALARADMDPGALATWDPTLARDARLLVPVDVQALVVPAADGRQAVPTETVIPASSPGDPDEQVLPRPPEPFGAPHRRAEGVHLHWAMPDGLTRGDAGAVRTGAAPAGNPANLPPLPDRWVVVRFVHGEQSTRAWVLEADRALHHDLAGWTEPGPLPAATTTSASGRRVIARERLTAVAGGDPAWAATYDAVVDRFGFHDDLADLGVAGGAEVSLSYLVAGWWSEPTLDPLHAVTSAGAYHDRTRRLGWLAPDPAGLVQDTVEREATGRRRAGVKLRSPAVPKGGWVAAGSAGADTDVTLTDASFVDEAATLSIASGPAAPRQTLLHGAVLGVWLGGGPDLAPSAAQVQVALGPTGFAALCAVLAAGSDEQHASSERVLAAFASGLLGTIDGPGGLAAVDEDRHASGFTAVATGMRARPDRVAEGDLLSVERTAPEPAHRTAMAASGGTGAGIKAHLVLRDDAAVRSASLEERYGGVRPKGRAPRTFRDVPVPQPRSFLPTDLMVMLRGAGRSLRHGWDGRFTADGRLACRLPTDVVGGLRGLVTGERLPEGLRTLGSGALPPEVDLLVREVALTDPYRWREALEWSGQAGPQAENRMRAEAALRHARQPTTRSTEPELDDTGRDVLRRASLSEGVDGSPVGVTLWAQPWVPLWCDWELELRVDNVLERWPLGPVDFEADDPEPASGTPARTVRGRTLLASDSARALAGQIQAWLSEEQQRDKAGLSRVGDRREAELAAAAAAAEGLDVLSGSLTGIRETLLGLDPHDAGQVCIDQAGAPTSKPAALSPPLLLAGGAATITRLRVVDAYGRWVDLPDAVLRAAEIAAVNDHPAGAPALTLPPRLQRPSRLAFRFIDPRSADGDPDVEARVDQQHPGQAVSPVAGWLLPDHVDEALECFDTAGAPLGQLMHDELTGAVVWEGAPGRPGPIGGPPDPGSDPGARHVTRLAAGLVEADARARTDPAGAPAESALSALLRAIDTTMWTVDPLGSIGTGAVAGLVGRPIAVVRALLRLDVDDDLDALGYPDTAAREARERAYADLAARALTVRLGELTRSDDGLLAYAVDDDTSHLCLVAPEVREQARVGGRLTGQLGVLGRGSEAPPAVSPIRHPYVDGPVDVALRAGQTVRLTLLLCPGGSVHATCGVLPRKRLALARDWFHDALVRLSPSFRVGPVLVDPTAVRLPMVTGLGDRQAFTHRDTPLTWRDDPIAAATQTAFLPEQPSLLREGWIRVQQEGRTP